MRRLSGAAAAALCCSLALPAVADARRAVKVKRPLDRAVVEAYPHLRSTAAQVPLRGRAARNATLLIRARCALGPCTTTTVTNRRGRWKATLHVILDPDRRRMGIRVLYPDAGTEGSDLIVVRPREPDWAAAMTGAAGELAMIGDSLAEGTAEPLRRHLSDWRATTDARRSRPMMEGMGVLDATPLPLSPYVLAFSLFTNDDPRNVTGLEASVRRSVDALRPGGCAIWATIVRPKVNGVSYRAANRRLRELEEELAPRMRLVDWATEVRGNRRRWLAADRVHATAEGYEARAALYARAARDCAAGR